MKRAREEEEKLKGLSPKEREEYKKAQTRLSGAYGVPDTILQLKPCVF